MVFQPSRYSTDSYGESLWDKYAGKAPNWTPVGWLYEDKEEKAAREAAQASGEALKAASSEAAQTAMLQSGGGSEAAGTAPEPEKEPFYKKPWFLPVVILGVAGAGAAVILWWPEGKPLPLIGRK